MRRWLTVLPLRMTLAKFILGLVTLVTIGFGVQACSGGSNDPVPGQPWHHVKGGFRNPPGSPPRTAGIFSDYVPFLVRRVFQGGRDVKLPAGHVLDEQTALAGLKALGPDDTITWLGHAAFLVRMGGKTILTDPFLTERASPVGWFGPRRLVPPAISIANLPPIDAIVISHSHYDHLDANTIEALPNKDRIDVYAPLGLGDFFRKRGYSRVHDLDWYQSEVLDGLSITCVPAVHFSRRGLFDYNKALWGGFVLEAGGRKLYFAGDTALGPVFKEIGARFAPIQTALIPIGAYEPRSIMAASHVTPEQAVALARDIGAETVVAMHWGTIVLTDEPQFEAPGRFRKAAAAAGYAPERVWVLKIGETRSIVGGSAVKSPSFSQLE